MTKSKTFAIIGGGIGGLTLAVALQKKGIPAVVYENATEIKPVGAGIVLAANAMKAFSELEMDNVVSDAGKVMKRVVIKDQKGNSLSFTDTNKVNRKFGLVNSVALHRADLHQILLNHILPGSLRRGKGLVDLSQNEDGITLYFNDGTSAHADYVIAADGIHSIVRKKFLPASQIRYSGYTCWRGVLSELTPGLNTEEASESWGAGKRFGIVPLTDKRVYWFATVNALPNDKDLASFGPIELEKLFKDFHSPISDIIRNTRHTNIIKNDIIDLVPVKQFSFGSIVLLGDAAHATTPNLGQGACLAIEDAVVLANCIESHEDPKLAFAEFERKRIPRTTQIVNTSYQLGKIGQWKNPFLIRVRNTMMKLAPERITDKQLEFLYNVSFT